MNPLLFEKDILRVFPLESIDSLNRFDVVVFWQHNMLLCHYYWAKNIYLSPGILLTRPLNPIGGHDHPIRSPQLLGIVPSAKINWWLKLRVIVKTF